MQIHVAKNGQQTGPFDEAQIREKLTAGEFAPTDLAWHADLAGWQPLSTLFPEAAGAPAAAPALPVAAVPVFPPAPSASSTSEPPLGMPAAPPAPAPSPFAMPPPAGGGYAPLPVAGLPGGPLTPPQFYNPGAVGADPNLASIWVRLGAVLVDAVLGSLISAPGRVMQSLGTNIGDNGEPAFGPLFWIGTLVSLVLAVGFIGFQIYLLSTQGQTVGKKLLGVRVVMLDGSRAGFVQAFLLRVLVNALGIITCIYPIVDACFIFRPDRRCIHDLLAGTKVVRA